MTPEQDNELLLNVPSNSVENAQTYVAIHRATDTHVAWRAIALLVSLAIAWWFVR
jgi:hypothetical protein